MTEPHIKRSEIKELHTEGGTGFRDLCRLAARLDYKDPFHQLINSDGSCVGDLIVFLEDNPGAIEAIYSWVDEFYGIDDDDDDDDDDDGE